MTNYNVSTSGELTTALSGASGGDTITCTADVGSVTISKNAASEIDILATAKQTGQWTLNSCNNIRLYGFTIERSGTYVNFTGTGGSVTIERMVLRKANQESATSWTDISTANGIDMDGTVASLSYIKVNDCTIGGCRNGIRFTNATAMDITNNIFDYMREDCIKISGHSGEVNITDNLFPRNGYFTKPESSEGAGDEDHADCCQLLGSPTAGTNFTGNIFLPGDNAIGGTGPSAQGFFASNGSPQNVVISQNISANSALPGFTTDDGGSSQTITNNLCLNYQPGGGSLAVVACVVTSGTMARNWNCTWKSSVASTGTPGGSNFTLYTGYEGAAAGTKAPWDYYQIDAGKQSHANMRGEITMDDLLPVEGAITDRNRSGATDDNTYGPFDTISRWHAGTWGHYSLRSSSGATSKAPMVAGGVPILAGGRLVVAA